MADTEVLIVGAGPTGLVLALWLTKAPPSRQATTRPDSNRSRIRLEKLKAAQQRRIAGLSHSRTVHRVELIDCRFSAVVVALIVCRNPAWTKVPVDLGRALTTVRQY